jgi:flagellar biosynthesis protein FlhA
MEDQLEEESGLASIISKVTRSHDLVVGFGLVAILLLMIVPIHPMVMDFAIAISISLGLAILLVSIYTKKSLDFSIFPSLLLLATLFRLSLNVASTRLILLNGSNEGIDAAGRLIGAFGDYVVKGNYAVGLIIFVILVIINFLVITKGAGRIAEVAARFMLDAMPGKQMAIDADLNAGIINESEAQERRKEISQEADFYGAMDGASKFVRGDAIAGVLIVFINVIGGIIVGVLQNGMSLAEAAKVFTLLTVGDGLVAQIPALIISTAAGMVVTRASTGENFGEEVKRQLVSHPKAMLISAGIISMVAFVPKFPAFPFLSIAGLLVFISWRVEVSRKKEIELDEIREREEEMRPKVDKLENLLSMDILELEVGYGLIPIVDADQDGELLERISQIRKQFAMDMGVIIPSVRIRDNLELKPGEYNVMIKGVKVSSGEMLLDHMLAMDPGDVINPIDGVVTTEPVFNLPAIWIVEKQSEEANYAGYTVVNIATVVATHLTETIRANLHELLGRQEAQNLIENFKEKNPKVVEDLIPNILPFGTVINVMQNLLREGIPIRDMRTILETLADRGTQLKDAEMLTEYVRASLYRMITSSVQDENGEVKLWTLERELEELMAESIVQTDQGAQLSLDPEVIQKILSSLNKQVELAASLGMNTVVLCSPVIRAHFKKLVERFVPTLKVVSHNELAPDVNVQSIGQVRLSDAG